VILIELVLPAVDPGVVAAAVAPEPPGAVAAAALSERATSPLEVAAVVVSTLFRLPLPQAVNATTVAHPVAATIPCHLLSIVPASFSEATAAAALASGKPEGRRARSVLQPETAIERAGRETGPNE
jgi:hypothetical protein